MFDPDQAFKLKPILKETDKPHEHGIVFNLASETVSSVIIQPNASISFNVICLPSAIQTYQASLQLTVTDNQFEDTVVQMVGEGYMEDFHAAGGMRALLWELRDLLHLETPDLDGVSLKERLGDGTHLSFHEAALVDYAGRHLAPRADHPACVGH